MAGATGQGEAAIALEMREGAPPPGPRSGYAQAQARNLATPGRVRTHVTQHTRKPRRDHTNSRLRLLLHARAHRHLRRATQLLSAGLNFQ